MAALRLGWAYCPPAIADVLNRVRGPFNVNVAGAGRRRRGGSRTAPSSSSRARTMTAGCAWLAHELRAARAHACTPSVAQFRAGRSSRPTAAATADGGRHFLKSRGIILRQMGGYGLPHCLRITIGTEEAMRRGRSTALRAHSSQARPDAMPEPLFERVALIGIGLIGSSLARAARERRLAGHIAVCARSRRDAATRRVELGLVDSSMPTPARRGRRRRPRHPVHAGRRLCRDRGGDRAASDARRHRHRCRLGQAGGDRATSAPHLPEGVHFVPGHPIAGTEHSGPEAGFAELFEGRWCILTPPPGTDAGAVERLRELWRRCGTQVEIMEPAHHDRVLAITSPPAAPHRLHHRRHRRPT